MFVFAKNILRIAFCNQSSFKIILVSSLDLVIGNFPEMPEVYCFPDVMNKRLVIAGGDALCCDHPSGHRRNLHSQIRNKIRQLRRKVPKENLMEGDTAGDYVDFIVNNDK